MNKLALTIAVVLDLVSNNEIESLERSLNV